MELQKVIEHFGSVRAICNATGLTHQAIYYWKRIGKIPEVWQFKLERLSKNKLKVNAK